MAAWFKKNRVAPPEQILWAIPVSHKEKMTKDDAKFVFEQAEKLLKDSVDTAAAIVTRTNTLITITTALLVAMSGYVISAWGSQDRDDLKFISAILGLIYLFFLAIQSVQTILPKSYYTLGSLPMLLVDPVFFVNAIQDDKRILRFYLSEIENYNFRTQWNNGLNQDGWRRYKTNLWFLIGTPIAFFIIYLLACVINWAFITFFLK